MPKHWRYMGSYISNIFPVYFLMIFLGWVQWMALVKSQRKWIGPLIMQLIPWWSDVTRTIHLLGIHNSFSHWIRVLRRFCNKSNLNFIFLSSIPFYMHQCVCEDRLTASTTWKSRENIWILSMNFLPQTMKWTGYLVAQLLDFSKVTISYLQGRFSHTLFHKRIPA